MLYVRDVYFLQRVIDIIYFFKSLISLFQADLDAWKPSKKAHLDSRDLKHGFELDTKPEGVDNLVIYLFNLIFDSLFN